MEEATKEAKSALTCAANDMARFYDLHRQEAPSYKKGDKVWLDAHNITTVRPSKKLDDKWFGPFKVLEKINDNAYRLELPPSFKIHPVFHVSKLRVFTENTLPRRQTEAPPPPFVSEDGTEEYEVEKILDS